LRLSSSPIARRLAVFVGAFALLTTLEYGLREPLRPLVNGVLNVQAGARLIELIAPGEDVRANGDRIESPVTFIQVAPGCEGLDVMALFVAAMLATPLAVRRKLLGTLAGLAVIYAANLVRLAGLWFCLRYAPARFEAMHVFVGQTAIIVVALATYAFATGLHTSLAAPAERLP
jgi:exosortase/archaeosortase family protein